jgi:hypothetical protein
MKTKIFAVLNLLAFAFHLILSYLVQIKYFSVLDVGQVSARYDTVFAPAGITFAIWGVIYLALFAFSLFHLYTAFAKSDIQHTNLDTQNIGWYFIVNNLATGLWLVAWVNEYLFISVILILIQLLTLGIISVKAHISNPARTVSTKIFTQFPLSIYFAWICIATIANISAYLKSVNWSGAGISESYWVIIMIGTATLISLFIILVRRNVPFGLVVLWALYGIVLKRQQVSPIDFEIVINAAYAAFAVILLALIIRIVSRSISDKKLINS